MLVINIMYKPYYFSYCNFPIKPLFFLFSIPIADKFNTHFQINYSIDITLTFRNDLNKCL